MNGGKGLRPRAYQRPLWAYPQSCRAAGTRLLTTPLDTGSRIRQAAT